MIVCHCNMIVKSEIVEVIYNLLDEDPWRLIVPLQVYHAMNQRGRCCGCFPGLVDLIIKVTADYHKSQETPDAVILSLVGRLQAENEARERARRDARARLRRTRAA